MSNSRPTSPNTDGLYWGLNALDLMHARDALPREDVIKFVLGCQKPNGGFGAAPNHDAHITFTLSAVQILLIEDALDKIDADQIADYIVSLHNKETGEVSGDEYGEVDTRFLYIALNCLSILGKLDRLNVEAMAKWIAACQNLDGGFGMVPGAESHAAQAFTCIGALTIARRLDLIDGDLACWWLSERQLPEGGLNGRPEKLPDVCYSWWVLSCLAMMKKLHWIDRDKLRTFILNAQDAEDGGIADREGDVADVFHTNFGLCGLSLLGTDGLDQVNPVYCLPQKVMHRVKQDPWKGEDLSK